MSILPPGIDAVSRETKVIKLVNRHAEFMKHEPAKSENNPKKSPAMPLTATNNVHGDMKMLAIRPAGVKRSK